MPYRINCKPEKYEKRKTVVLMFSRLKGKIEEKFTDAVVLDCNGIGYYIRTPADVPAKLPEIDHEAMLYVQMVKSKTDIILVGFLNEQYRSCFNCLSAVSGCGVKSSLAILGAFSPDQIYNHIAGKNDAAISQVKGVGKKLAKRIVLELYGRIESCSTEAVLDAQCINSDHGQMAVDALVSLGFRKKEAESAVAKVDQSMPLEQVISSALKMCSW